MATDANVVVQDRVLPRPNHSAGLVWWFDGEEDFGNRSFHEATLAWVSSLGLDPNRIKPCAAVVPYNGRYELHVDECVWDEDARDGRIDPLQNDVLGIRRIIPVEKDSWPSRPAEVVV